MNLGRGSRMVLVLAATIVTLAGVKLAAPVLVPFLLAAFITITTAPVVLWMVGRGVPRVFAVVIAILLDVGALFGLGLMIVVSLDSFTTQLPHYQERLSNAAAAAEQWLDEHGIARDVIAAMGAMQARERAEREHEMDLGMGGPPYDIDLEPGATSALPTQQGPGGALSSLVDPGAVMEVVVDFLGSIAAAVSNLLLVIVFVVLMLFEAIGLEGKLRRILPHPDTEIVQFSQATREVQKYLLVKTIASLATGALIWAWVAFLGVDFPVLWGLIAFLLSFVPTVGGIIAAIPAVIVALIQLGVGPAAAVTLGYVVVNFVIGNFIEPKALGRAVGLSPLVVVLSVILWGWLLGPVGALLSVPLTMGVKIFAHNTRDARWLAVMLGPASASQMAPLEPGSPVANFPPGARAVDTLPPP